MCATGLMFITNKIILVFMNSYSYFECLQQLAFHTTIYVLVYIQTNKQYEIQEIHKEYHLYAIEENFYKILLMFKKISKILKQISKIISNIFINFSHNCWQIHTSRLILMPLFLTQLAGKACVKYITDYFWSQFNGYKQF